MTTADKYSDNFLVDSGWGQVLAVVVGTVIAIAASIGYDAWHEAKTKEVLYGPAKGAYRLYGQRSDIKFDMLKLSTRVSDERSNGAYLAAV